MLYYVYVTCQHVFERSPMKSHDLENSKIKKQLLTKKNRGENFVIWSLTPQQVEFIQGLGFETIPYIFRISTKIILFKDVRNKSAILKEVHYASRDRKSRIFRKLNHSDRRLLKEYGVYYTPFKYKVILN